MTWDVCGYRSLRWRSVCDGEEFPYTVMNITEGKLRPPDFDSVPASSISPIPPPWSLGTTDRSRRSAGRLRLTSLTIRHVKKHSSITVITSAACLTSQIITPTTPLILNLHIRIVPMRDLVMDLKLHFIINLALILSKECKMWQVHQPYRYRIV